MNSYCNYTLHLTFFSQENALSPVQVKDFETKEMVVMEAAVKENKEDLGKGEIKEDGQTTFYY